MPSECANEPGGLRIPAEGLPNRKVAVADDGLAGVMKLDGMCPAAVALEMGTEPQYLPHHTERFVGSRGDSARWFSNIAQVAE